MTAAAEVLVLEHTAAAGVSAFADVLDAHPAVSRWRRVDVPNGGALPERLDEVAGLIVLGGTMSAVDPSAHGWMGAEIALLRNAVDAEVPVLGVCLGAQLLGQALDGEVVARDTPELGYRRLSRTPAGRDDEVLAAWTDEAPALFAHEDEVRTLPPGAVGLLSGTDDGVPAWRLGTAHAVQFHPEVTPDQLRTWIDTGAMNDFLDRAGLERSELLGQADRYGTRTLREGQALLDRWLTASLVRA